MIPASNNAIAPVTLGEGGLPFQVFQTSPSHITCHTIFDYELDRLVNISRPLTVGFATLLLGAALGLLPSVLETVDLTTSGRPIGTSKLVILLVFGMCFASGCVFGFFAMRGQKDADNIRAEVRARTAVAITPPSNTGAPSESHQKPRKSGKVFAQRA